MCGTSRRRAPPRCYAGTVTLRPVLSATLALSLGACTSDDLFAAGSTSSGSSSSSSDTTAVPTTGAPDLSTSSTGDPTTGAPTTTSETTGEPPPETTCGDLIDCLPGCLMDPDPVTCLGMCTQGLPPDQAMNAIALGLCIGQGCFESGACSLDMIQDPICLACIGFGLVSKNPPGCEDQADACNGN